MTGLPKWLKECPVCHRIFKHEDPDRPLGKHKDPNNPYLDCLGSGMMGIPRGLG
jgi:hypothetical protein